MKCIILFNNILTANITLYAHFTLYRKIRTECLIKSSVTRIRELSEHLKEGNNVILIFASDINSLYRLSVENHAAGS